MTADLLPIATYVQQVAGRYTLGAVRKKISRGQWRPGLEYYKAPDGAIWISISGVEAWVRGDTRQASRSTTARSGSISGLPVTCTERL